VTLLIISILLCIVLFDFALLGILPKYFKIWPALDSSIGKRFIEESTMFSIIKVDFEYNAWGYRSGGLTLRINDWRLLLTSNSLFIKNTRLTYIWKVDIKSIEFFEVKKSTLGVLGDGIVIHFKQENQPHFLEFRTFKLESWLKRLEEVGITDRTKK
jgi:hypothetical protein